MTLRDFMCRVYAHRRRQEARFDDQLNGWRQTRFLATVLLNINRGPDDPVLTPEEVLELPGDPPPPEAMRSDELDAELARVAALDKDWL